MKRSSNPLNLYCTAPKGDAAYKAWLGDVERAHKMHTGVSMIENTKASRIARRWYREGRTPYEAVKLYQRWIAR